MTATSLQSQALRLPRDLALITVVISAVMLFVSMAARLLPDSPDSQQLRSAYALPGVWIPMVCSIAMGWVLSAAIAWCHGRNALERRGAGSVARLPQPRLRYAAAYVVVQLLNAYALSPLLYDLQLLFMPGGRFHESLGFTSMSAAMPVFVFLQSVAQLIVLVLGIWLSAWIALRGARAETEGSTGAHGDEAIHWAPPRRAVALVAASVFASLQMWSGAVMSRWSSVAQDMNAAQLLVAWVVPPLAAFGMAFWGTWMGAAPIVSRVRPFRAMGASVLAFVLVQLLCIAAGLAWLSVAFSLHGFNSSPGSLIGFALMLVLLYILCTVLLTRAITRGLYRRYL